MAITVRIPTPLRNLTEDKDIVEASGATIRDLVDDLESNYQGLKERIVDEDGNIRRFVNIFVNDEDIRFLDNIGTVIKDGDDVSILPAIAGG